MSSVKITGPLGFPGTPLPGLLADLLGHVLGVLAWEWFSHMPFPALESLILLIPFTRKVSPLSPLVQILLILPDSVHDPFSLLQSL